MNRITRTLCALLLPGLFAWVVIAGSSVLAQSQAQGAKADLTMRTMDDGRWTMGVAPALSWLPSSIVHRPSSIVSADAIPVAGMPQTGSSTDATLFVIVGLFAALALITLGRRMAAARG